MQPLPFSRGKGEKLRQAERFPVTGKTRQTLSGARRDGSKGKTWFPKSFSARRTILLATAKQEK